MIFFILGSIIGVLLLISAIIYYKLIKKVKKVSELTCVHCSVLCLIVKIVNKLMKRNFTAIANPFNSRIHIITKTAYETMSEEDILYRHELVHVYQIKKLGRIRFIIKDAFYTLRYGYTKNPFEVEAYKLENNTIEEIKKHFEG